MARQSRSQSPLRISGGAKRDTRTQFAALPFRRKKQGVEVLLITSLDTGRWIIPKGWPMDGLTPSEAAAQEAWEECGARGKIYENSVGLYSYSKWLDEEMSLPCVVVVFPLEVGKFDKTFPEKDQRKRKWFSPNKAASRVEEPELKQLLRRFDPDHLR